MENVANDKIIMCSQEQQQQQKNVQHKEMQPNSDKQHRDVRSRVANTQEEKKGDETDGRNKHIFSNNTD